jgi:hypothetical protein
MLSSLISGSKTDKTEKGEIKQKKPKGHWLFKVPRNHFSQKERDLK